MRAVFWFWKKRCAAIEVESVKSQLLISFWLFPKSVIAGLITGGSKHLARNQRGFPIQNKKLDLFVEKYQTKKIEQIKRKR
jgi:hypothetical protein